MQRLILKESLCNNLLHKLSWGHTTVLLNKIADMNVTFKG